VQVSDYVRKVQDFNSMVVAKTPDGWRVRGSGNLHELRAPLTLGQPQVETGGALAGFNRRGDSQYLHVADSEANIRFRKSAADVPYLVYANARVSRLNAAATDKARTLDMGLSGQVPLQFALSMNVHCSVRAEGKLLGATSRTNGVSHFSTKANVIDQLRIHCPR
jgi:hypothetical protein